MLTKYCNKLIFASALLLLGGGGIAQAALINLGPGSFTPAASRITFSEAGYPLGTVNPTYLVTAGTLGNVTISFAGKFLGQTVVGGGVRTLTGTPTGPLTLDTSVPTTIVGDGANPTSPVLSGSPTFNGPISVFFSTPVAAVGLDGGFFNALGATSIEAYDASGVVLGSITNSQLGIETYGLADASGNNVISGISFYITGNEPAGFAIDNLTFGAREILVNPPSVPDGGATIAMLGVALMGMAGLKRKLGA